MPVMLRTDQLEAWLSGQMPIEQLPVIDFECTGFPCDDGTGEQDGDCEQISLFDLFP
jgi:hypothetical protein